MSYNICSKIRTDYGDQLGILGRFTRETGREAAMLICSDGTTRYCEGNECGVGQTKGCRVPSRPWIGIHTHPPRDDEGLSELFSGHDIASAVDSVSDHACVLTPSETLKCFESGRLHSEHEFFDESDYFDSKDELRRFPAMKRDAKLWGGDIANSLKETLPTCQVNIDVPDAPGDDDGLRGLFEVDDEPGLDEVLEEAFG